MNDKKMIISKLNYIFHKSILCSGAFDYVKKIFLDKNLHKKDKTIFLERKKKKLIFLLDSVLKNGLYKNELSIISRKFNLTKEEVIKYFLDYNMDVFSHGNEIYQSQAIRIILYIHNLIEGSWHIERQQVVCKFIEQANPCKVIDLGFGVPSRYIRESLVSDSFHLTLCDTALPAFEFAREILESWNNNWFKRIKFLHADIEDVEACVGDYDLYISLHSIEHVPNPTRCLSEYVKLSMPKALFLIEIPIGPITPEHYMSWDNPDQARKWLERTGLDIISKHVTYVNPDVDLFAEPHNYNYGGYLALCRKINDQ